MTKDEAFLEYEEALAKIDEQAHKAREEARDTLRERLKVLRTLAHKELKAIRAISQKTKRSNKNG